MRQAVTILTLSTPGPGLTDFTARLRRWVAEQGIETGLLSLMCRHTSASLTIQENADPDVQTDLQRGIDRLAPRDFDWIHSYEGADDMPAHLRSVLSGVTLSIPVIDGAPALGTWQGVYLWEHRDRPHRREIAVHLSGE